MALRIATWNVNSLRQRLDHLARFCGEYAPDLLLLQETKVPDDLFPRRAVAEMGFEHRAFHGEKAYNGVAILSRIPFAATDRKDWLRKGDCRHLSVRLADGLEVHNFYVPSGGDVPDPEQNPKFDHKLKFLRSMARWCRKEAIAERPVLIAGDFNVAPLETDVWNHKRLLRSVGHTPTESKLIGQLRKAATFIDVPRHFVPPDQPLYTWWGYRFAQSVEKNYGWRLDHLWVTEPLRPRLKAMRVAKETRTWDKPSDHVPVIVELD
jgi:exodeoxyribonuclease-3